MRAGQLSILTFYLLGSSLALPAQKHEGTDKFGSVKPIVQGEAGEHPSPAVHSIPTAFPQGGGQGPVVHPSPVISPVPKSTPNTVERRKDQNGNKPLGGSPEPNRPQPHLGPTSEENEKRDEDDKRTHRKKLPPGEEYPEKRDLEKCHKQTSGESKMACLEDREALGYGGESAEWILPTAHHTTTPHAVSTAQASSNQPAPALSSAGYNSAASLSTTPPAPAPSSAGQQSATMTSAGWQTVSYQSSATPTEAAPPPGIYAREPNGVWVTHGGNGIWSAHGGNGVWSTAAQE